MDDLKTTGDSTQGVTSQPSAAPDIPPIKDQTIPKPTPPEPAPVAPVTTQPEKPPESPPQITTTQTTTTAIPEEKPKFKDHFPKAPKKKIVAGIAMLVVVILGGISIASAWRLKRVEKIIPEEAKASEGNQDHCTASKCTISLGPGYIAFEAKGHGTRNSATPTVKLNIPNGSTVYKAYAIWTGSRDKDTPKDKTFNLKVNNNPAKQVTATVDYNTAVITKKYHVEPDTFLADITSLLPKNTTDFTFSVTSGFLQGGYNDDGGGGAGMGVSFIVIYKNPSNPYNKIIIKVWGEFVMRNVSANMVFNIADRKPGSNKLRMAFFLGEGEGAMVGDGRPNALYYNENSNKTLKPTDGTPYPAWGSDPGYWWDTRITGGNLPAITALANTATFHTQSYPAVTTSNGVYGESFYWSGAMAEYEMEAPSHDCWEECSQQGNCDSAGLTCATPPGDTVQRCLDSNCPSEQTCVCPITTCLDLTATPSAEILKEGDQTQFTCRGSSGVDKPINHTEFRLQIDGGDWQALGTASVTKTNGEYEGSIAYDVSQAGSYRVECRVCTSEDSSECTQWGEAE